MPVDVGTTMTAVPGDRAPTDTLIGAVDDGLTAAARAAGAAAELDLVDLVERQVAATPDAVAVVGAGFGRADAALSYAELDRAANRLASRLQRLGVGREVFVGVCVERSLDLTVALLAVLKAGGVALPLDPSYPAGRLRTMIGDADPAVILTQAAHRDLVRAARTGEAAHVLDLDAERDLLAGESAERPGRDRSPDRLAYLIYTSGSTGEPRGVMLPHAALVNHCLAARDRYELVPGERVLQFCSISFDVSVEELFPTWAAGATVVLRPPDVPILGRPWLEWLDAQRLTVLNLPTAYWHEWVRDLQARGDQLPPRLRVVIVGGERALASAYRGWRSVGGDRVRWFNAYGPCETSVMATLYEVPPGAVVGPAGTDDTDPPIGRPLPGITVHLLDPEGRPVADGAVGELYIGGVGLARGYLNHPELTAQRFVPDPFTDRPGARLYRTGDLCRLRPDGELEFVGRQDRQVKVAGGFRVECGEVEAALAALAGVADAAVLPTEERAGQRDLVGYVVAEPGATVTGASLRHALADRLPAYMVPVRIAVLDDFPLTPNGKVDHAALPELAQAQNDVSRTAIAPRTPTEQALLEIFTRVLGAEGLGVTDDLFELGVHSLQATQIVVAVQEACGRPLSLGTLLARPSVAALAELLAAEGARLDPAAPSPRDVRRPADGRIPLSLPQEQMWSLEHTSGLAANENVTGRHRFDEPVDVDAMAAALRHLVARHESLRTSFGVHDGRAYQQVAAELAAELGHTDLRAGAPAEREEALSAHLRAQDLARFDLGRAPLFRARLYQLAEAHSVLAITLDHMICDGPSAYILLSELVTAYRATVHGVDPALPALAVQYADFALWQREWATEDRLAAQLEYWRRTLADSPLGPALPLDRVPATPTRRLRQLPISVGPVTYAAVAELARRSAASVFVVCVAAVGALLSRLGGTADVVVTTTLSGRQRAEVEGVVGNFAGTGRIRTDLAGDPTFAEAVRRAREAVIGLFEHQDIPFFWVRDAVLPDLSSPDSPPMALLPVELQYFRAAYERWVPGSGVLERPGPDKGPDELFFRGQLHPLSLTLLDDGSQLWGEATYKLDFYDEATIARLVDGLAPLLDAALADPNRRLSDLPVG